MNRSTIVFGRLVYALIAIAVITNSLSISIEAQAQTVTPGPHSVEAYKRAWPIQVPVLTPDPVLGDAKTWEYWVYDKSFAERFKGFDPKKIDPELNPGVHAIVFRAYKRKIFDRVPDMFVCEYSIYFDSRVRIPLSNRDDPLTYPPGITYTFRDLRALRAEDAQALSQARSVGKAGKSKPLIFADGKLDGRYANFALDYFPDLVPGMSMASLRGGDFTCKVIGPKRPGSHHWFWLFGELPYNPAGSPEVHTYSERFRKWINSGTFDAGSAEKTLANGHVRMPEAFYEAVLSKVTLIKAVNQCIADRSGYASGVLKDINGSKVKRLQACGEVEREGIIYEDSLNGLVRGWHRPSF